MFWSFGLSKDAIKDFKKLDTTVQSTLLAEHDCNIFNYQITEKFTRKS